MRHLIIAALASLLTACASLGVPTPATFQERTAAAYQSVTGARNTARLLLEAGSITADDAANVQQQADNLRAGIDLARRIHTTTPVAGDAKLDATVIALNALVAYLETQQ